MADSEALCEAVTRPSMRFVPIKSEEQKSGLVLHRSRDLLMRQRTMMLNAIRAHLAEFGIIAAKDQGRLSTLSMAFGMARTLGSGSSRGSHFWPWRLSLTASRQRSGLGGSA